MPERVTLAPLVKEPLEIEDDEGAVWTCWPTLKGSDAILIFRDSSIVSEAMRGGPALEWLAGMVAKSLRRAHREQATPEWVLEHFEPMQVVDVVLAFLRLLGRFQSSEATQAEPPAEPTTRATRKQTAKR
jgi:hypothetical protein